MKMLCLVLCLICAVVPSTVCADEYHDVGPADHVTLPDDLFFKNDYRVQWWYFTGHLFDGSGREFGYELTFFVVGVQRRRYASRFGVNEIYISHFAVTDTAGRRYYFDDTTDSGAFGFAGAAADSLRVWVVRNEMKGGEQRIRLKASAADIALDLTLEPQKPFVLHGDRGYSRKSSGSALDASLYFSCTRLKTNGVLTAGGREQSVTGDSWFDRELSSRGLGPGKAGWDWFAVQLADGREVMLYMIRNSDGSIDPYSSGTVVSKDGRYRHLTKDDFRVDVLDHYRSSRTGAVYPSQWDVRISSEDLQMRITPLIRDQEFIAAGSTGDRYWEGTCEISGQVAGRAYVELTGY